MQLRKRRIAGMFWTLRSPKKLWQPFKSAEGLMRDRNLMYSVVEVR
jgi:hypothetical protein